jgi:hypothetical protein
MEQLRALETAVVFKEFDGLNDLVDLENFTRVKFFECEKSFRESIPHVESFIPSKKILFLRAFILTSHRIANDRFESKNENFRFVDRF